MRIFPEMWARTLCPFSSSTRNIALGSGSTTVPSTRIVSSLGLATVHHRGSGRAKGTPRYCGATGEISRAGSRKKIRLAPRSERVPNGGPTGSDQGSLAGQALRGIYPGRRDAPVGGPARRDGDDVGPGIELPCRVRPRHLDLDGGLLASRVGHRSGVFDLTGAGV